MIMTRLLQSCMRLTGSSCCPARSFLLCLAQQLAAPRPPCCLVRSDPRARAPSEQRRPQVALHHYVTKSLAEFQAKSARGCGMGGGPKTIHFYQMMETESTAKCTDAVPLAAMMVSPKL